ncbi:MAG: biopolymer transporter ExbD [Candidatus Cloacimonetes bacterium]|nr:biopolymer transporter ExbD [Candidatus Cloacimonadota bacterium]
MANIKKPKKPEVEIPTASMADIAFLLLLFFMVSTVFVKEKGLRVELPRANEETINKIPRKQAITIYINRSGIISIDDMRVEIPQVKDIMVRKYSENYSLVSSFRTDSSTEYGVMADIMNQLRNAETLRVFFEAKKKLR